MSVPRGEREQRALLSSLDITVERERRGKGSHLMLYCLGPGGQRFTVTVQRDLGDPRARKNFRSYVLNALKSGT